MLLRRHQSLRRKPRQSRASFTFESILDAAQEILKSGDPESFQMAALARRAGVSSGTLYQYFPDWGSVLSAVLERSWARSEAEFRTRFEAMAPQALPELLEALSGLVAEITHRDQPLRREVRREKQRRRSRDRAVDQSEQWVEYFVRVLQPFIPNADKRLWTMARAMVWAADGIVEGSIERPETSVQDLRASLLAIWRGVVTG